MRAEDIIRRQPVGTLIVDAATVVTFANPTAVAMLGVSHDRLVGEAFGLPLVSDGVTDVNVRGEGSSVRTLAMRVTPLPGGDGSRLVSLFDVSGRARLYEHEHRLVESLQRSLLLERLPRVPGVSLAARYVPGDGEVRVGGDWYDAIPLAHGRLGLAIGDVTGHGVGSAAMMSQLRNTLRAYALEHDAPGTVLERLDFLLARLEPRGMATVVYSIYDPSSRVLRLAAAGHPFPLLARRGEDPEFLDGGRSPLLGIGASSRRNEARIAVPPSSTLVLYTDGLLERRAERSIDQGLQKLAEIMREDTADPEQACQTILDELVGDEPPMDDIALLVMRTD